MSTDVARGLVDAEATAGVDEEATAGVDVDDPREQVEVVVLMPNGRFAPRQFASRAEAEAWARPEEGERVVEMNILCECTF